MKRENKMKKLPTIILMIFLILSMTACSDSKTNDTEIIAKNTTETKEFSTTEAITTTQKTILSESCDMVLCYGTSSNGIVYELVANEEENYLGTQISVGVIKNNEWLVNLTTNSPFIREDGFFYIDNEYICNSLESVRKNKLSFDYIGNGCFMLSNHYGSPDYMIWNTYTGKYFKAKEDTAIVFDKKFVSDEGKFIIQDYNKGGFLLDTNTMETTELLDPVSQAVKEYDFHTITYSPYSEGLYLIKFYKIYSHGGLGRENIKFAENKYIGFFDLKGNFVIDLTEYELCHDNWNKSYSFAFKNNLCDIEIVNDQGSIYNITIDKTGNVTNNYKVQ